MALVENQEESHLLNIEDASGEKTIHTATGVYWCDGTSWHVAEGLLEHCRNIGVDEFDEASIYILYRYILGRPFTPEEYHAATLNEFLSEEENQKRLEHLRMVFTSIL
ncbi:hypothetical protein AB0D40_31715 [Streptomyces massasporeus]|uniref:hypothetical protein n=1 Tax=Streptomyces massasporeus TaxID=67324 RepID=UPI0033E35081